MRSLNPRISVKTKATNKLTPASRSRVSRGHWSSIKNQREFIESIAAQRFVEKQNDGRLKLHLYETLYSATSAKCFGERGARLLGLYNGSRIDAIITLFPDHAWQMWRFPNSASWWEHLVSQAQQGDAVSIATLREVMDYGMQEHSLKSVSDWQHIANYGPIPRIFKPLLQHISLKSVLRLVYPLEAWNFRDESQGAVQTQTRIVNWEDSTFRKKFLLDLCKERFDGKLENMYSITANDLHKSGAYPLLSRHMHSAAVAVMVELNDVFPWKPWLFKRVPPRWWAEFRRKLFVQQDPHTISLAREFIEYTAAKCGIDYDRAGWKQELLSKAKTSPMIRLRKALVDVSNALMLVYEHKTDIGAIDAIVSCSERRKRQHGFWDNPWERRAFFDKLSYELKEKYGIGIPHAFYLHLNEEILSQYGGIGLVRLKYGTYINAVMTEYPDIAWKPWNFTSLPRSWLESLMHLTMCSDPVAEAAMRNLVDDVANSYGICDLQQWLHFPFYAIKWQILRGNTFRRILQILYPNHDWSNHAGYASQKQIALSTQELLSL